MPPTTKATSYDVIIDRVDLILKRLDALVQKMDDAEKDRATFVLGYVKDHTVLDSKATAAHDRITKHEAAEEKKWEKFEEVNKQVGELRHFNKIMIWAAGIIVTAVILWLVGQVLRVIML